MLLCGQCRKFRLRLFLQSPSTSRKTSPGERKLSGTLIARFVLRERPVRRRLSQ